MADEKKPKQGGQKPPGGQKPQSKKAKPEQVEAASDKSAGKPARPKATNRATARLRERYYKEVLPALMKEFRLENTMAAPKLEKIVVNMGVGEATQNAKVIDPAVSSPGFKRAEPNAEVSTSRLVLSQPDTHPQGGRWGPGSESRTGKLTGDDLRRYRA